MPLCRLCFIFCFNMNVLTCLVYCCVHALACLQVYVDIFFFIYFLMYIYKCICSCYNIYSDLMYLVGFWIVPSLVFMYMQVVYLFYRYSSGNFIYKIISFKYKLFIYNIYIYIYIYIYIAVTMDTIIYSWYICRIFVV